MAHPCLLMRLLTPRAVCVRLDDTGAFVLAELAEPLSPRSIVKAQRVHALAPVEGSISLGPYNVARHAFTDCQFTAQLPEPDYQRTGYVRRKLATGAPGPAASGAPPPHSGPGLGGSCVSAAPPAE